MDNVDNVDLTEGIMIMDRSSWKNFSEAYFAGVLVHGASAWRAQCC